MKEKVLIVDTVSYERAPYIKIYEDCCIKNNIDYDIFVWNKRRNKQWNLRDRNRKPLSISKSPVSSKR